MVPKVAPNLPDFSLSVFRLDVDFSNEEDVDFSSEESVALLVFGVDFGAF